MLIRGCACIALPEKDADGQANAVAKLAPMQQAITCEVSILISFFRIAIQGSISLIFLWPSGNFTGKCKE